MKRIVCFGDSNTWGYDAKTGDRFSDSIRWCTLLQRLLGSEYQVIEEGLSGRTAVSEDSLFEGLNGYTYIHPCLMSHYPLELVVIMLGTNDTKERFGLTSYNIAQGITRIALKAKATLEANAVETPKVLVVAPPPIDKKYYNTEVGRSMGKDCDLKSQEISRYLLELLQPHGIEFLDTKGIVHMNEIDYMHLDENGHKILSKLVFDKIKKYNKK